MTQLNKIRQEIRRKSLIDEQLVLNDLTANAKLTENFRAQVSQNAENLIKELRSTGKPAIMEEFLAEYGLSNKEGIALMCLAEALLRVPDIHTIDELIEDKIAPSSWSKHLGHSSSPLVNASTWALMLTGNILQEPEELSISDTLHLMIRRLGEPVIRTAAKHAIKEIGNQFVLGETIADAIDRGYSNLNAGHNYSFDMLGEAAITANDARQYFDAYTNTIQKLGEAISSDNVRENAGISIKLSALHPRYEPAQKERVMKELVPRVNALCQLAKKYNMGLNIDAEEAYRLDLSLDVIEAVLSSPDFKDWEGFGVVIQAYSKCANDVIDWLYTLATMLDRKIMVRLVKGAYWDKEIKIAQVNGVKDFPVFTKKPATDISYICCAKKLMKLQDRIFPQFATHNAHTISAILAIAKESDDFEFQRLHGMGETLHSLVAEQYNTRCRIYAPVGPHRDLLAYLVRRLLEQGANSSIVNQLVDQAISPAEIAADPLSKLNNEDESSITQILKPTDLFLPERKNSQGWNLDDPVTIERLEKQRAPYAEHIWSASPMVEGYNSETPSKKTFCPTDKNHQVGEVSLSTTEHLDAALNNATDWSSCSAKERAKVLSNAANLYEQNAGEIFAALSREAGKTMPDAVAELREAVDFLRFYGARAVDLANTDAKPRGLISCISPWNFPLAIFTGQISAALAAANGVLAKPAGTTPIIASIGVRLLHEAGVPKNVLQLLPGPGSLVGTRLISDNRISGVCFTGSTSTAHLIHRTMAKELSPDAMFIAETGGLNAMVVDSTALPEQAIRDIINAAFQSAGQRCSALRVLYVQEDIAEDFMKMLLDAMDELTIGNPWNLHSDIGPVIDETSKQNISEYIEKAKNEGRLLKKLEAPQKGTFIGPAVIKVDGISDLEKEVFGPVLHVATFQAQQIDEIISEINNMGYGLTFALHTRIDDRVEQIRNKIKAGNIYINRNQIGAIVGSQPFGGEGLSGTGPKAGGAHYVPHFTSKPLPLHASQSHLPLVSFKDVQAAVDKLKTTELKTIKEIKLPGPTGEDNHLTILSRGIILCLGPTAEDTQSQVEIASSMGCQTIAIAPGISEELGLSGFLNRECLSKLVGIHGVALWSEVNDLRDARSAIAKRDGPILPLIATNKMAEYCTIERHICTDTTAAGGNLELLTL